MADFMNPFIGMTPDRKLTARELTRAIRLALAAEHEAIHLYECLADASDHPVAAGLFQEIADEERDHVGEFHELLRMLIPDEQTRLDRGAKEVRELLIAQGKTKPKRK